MRRVVRLIGCSEYKRRQAPVGIRITHRGFGKDWRYPITNRFRDDEAGAYRRKRPADTSHDRPAT